MDRRALIVLLSMIGCADREVHFVPRDQVGSDYGFFLFIDALGTTVDTEGPVFFEDGAPTKIPLPEVEFDRAVFIGFDDARLKTASPSFDPSRASTLELKGRASDCPVGELSRSGSRLNIPVPDSVELLVLGPASDWLPTAADAAIRTQIADLSLDLPADTTLCFEPGERFEPYGGVDPILEVGDLVGGRPVSDFELQFPAVVRLPDDRIILASKMDVLMVHRGRKFEDEPGQSVSLFQPEDKFQIEGIAVDPDPLRGNGGLRILVATVEKGGVNPSKAGALFELWLGPNGLERVGTSTQTTGPLESILINPKDGRMLLGSRPGIIYTMLPGGPLEAITLPVPPDDKGIDFFSSGLEDRPYIIGGAVAGALLFGDPSAHDWVSETGLPDGAAIRAFASRPGAAGSPSWAGSTEGRFFASEETGRWDELTPRFGPPFSSCLVSEPECGWYRNAQATRGLVPLDERDPSSVLAFVDTCAGVYIIRSDLACAEIIPIADRPFATAAGKSDFKKFHANEDWVTLASPDGSVYELRRRP